MSRLIDMPWTLYSRDGIFLHITDEDSARMLREPRSHSTPPTVGRTWREEYHLNASSLDAEQQHYVDHLMARAQETADTPEAAERELREYMLRGAPGSAPPGATDEHPGCPNGTHGGGRDHIVERDAHFSEPRNLGFEHLANNDAQPRPDGVRERFAASERSFSPPAPLGGSSASDAAFHEDDHEGRARGRLVHERDHEGRCGSTLMIRNIPCRLSQEDLMTTIRGFGLDGTYNFLYVVMSHRPQINVGYAFVNLTDEDHEQTFFQAFNGFRFPGFESQKVCTIQRARLQGLEANLAQFQRRRGYARGHPFLLGRSAAEIAE